MKNVEIYTGPMCIFCDWAKELLEKKGVAFKEIYIGADWYDGPPRVMMDIPK